MKKISCFIESLAGGGAEHQMAILAEFLVENGYDVTIVTYADVQDHYRVSSRIKRIRIVKTKYRVLKLLAIFIYYLREKPDCVISFRQACNARVLLPLLFRRKIRVICSERNLSMGVPTFYERVLFGFLYKRANVIVTNSYSQFSYINNHYSLYREKMVSICNYTDLDLFKPIKHKINSDVLKIAVFARFSAQKNCKRFVIAMHGLRMQFAQNFELHWYGNPFGTVDKYSDEYLDVLDYINKNNMGNYFFIHKPVAKTACIINQYDAICLPSLYEGFSNSIAEAICCGMPMLVSDVSDNSLMVRDGENGFLFNPLNRQDIINAFVKFFSTSLEQRVQMGKRSREIAETLFDKSRFIHSYIGLIEDEKNID